MIVPPDLNQARVNKCLIALVNRKIVTKDSSTVRGRDVDQTLCMLKSVFHKGDSIIPLARFGNMSLYYLLVHGVACTPYDSNTDGGRIPVVYHPRLIVSEQWSVRTPSPL